MERRTWNHEVTASAWRVYAAAVLLGALTAGAAAGALPKLPDDCWGVYSWCSWNPRKTTRVSSPDVVGVPIVLKWNSLEPADGKFLFDEQLSRRLKQAKANGFYVMVMLWAGPAAPKWIYDRGVPLVKCSTTVNPFGKTRKGEFPYYFDDDYKRYFFRVVRALGRYVTSLPADLRKRIIFVQSAEGSTGDGYCYKGKPLEAKYAISRAQWSRFRIETWQVYKEAFSVGGKLALRILVNGDANREPEHEWLMKNLDAIGCKQGMFSHGYHISETVDRLARWRQFAAQAERAGKEVFTRGEQDGEWKVCPWSSRNPLQALYWSAIFATHCGLDMWNVPAEACVGRTYAPALRLFNKYAHKRDAASAPAAFCALRRGLDAADVKAFPEKRFGKARKSNVQRYVKIARAFAARGAYQGDPRAAVGGGMRNRQRTDYNDAGWKIVGGNYRRFLEQVDPNGTSVGWWHVGPALHHYSRFARGFDHASGRKAMYFRLDGGFFARGGGGRRVTIRVAYLDRGKGTWVLNYAGPAGRKRAMTVTCGDTGKWIDRRIDLPDAHFTRALDGKSDLVLGYVRGDDTIFHMIELDRK